MTEPSPKTLSDIIADAVRAHGHATADLVKRAGASDQEVDLAREMVECTDRAIGTAARFFVYWDNFLGILGDGDRPAPRYGESPIGTPNCQASAKVELKTGTPKGRIETTGLRRRGSKGKTPKQFIPPAMITLEPDDFQGQQTPIEVKVACQGVLRGVYEGSLCVGGTGPACAGGVVTPYNVYVDPSP